LLAATLCVDLVAILLLRDDPFSERGIMLYFGLAYGQLSAMAVWAVLRPTKVGARWLIPFAAAVLFAFLLTVMWEMLRLQNRSEMLYTLVSLLSLHVIGAMAVAWLLRPTRWFARWTTADRSHRWQFGVGHLLVLMTGLSVLLVVVGRATPGLSDHDVKNILTMVLANGLLLFAVLFAVEHLRFWLFSLSASLGAALALAATCVFFSIALADELSLYPLNIIQALVLWCWVKTLMPSRDSTASAAVVAETHLPTAP